MIDIAMTNDGDIKAGDDIELTGSVRQSVLIRLRWFLGEWKFSPGAGLPYFEEFLKKRPDAERIRQYIREAALGVPGVLDVKDINVLIDPKTRSADMSMTVVTDEGAYREELTV